MKLHSLHDNRELVMQLLDHWDYDADGLDLLDRFRISANAVYPFKCREKLRFLRFAPVSEKRPGQSEAELAFLAWLDRQGYCAGQPVPSRSDRLLEICETQWGRYQASVFEGVAGVRLDGSELTDNRITAYGQSLARLHELSSRYEPLPRNRPWNWKQVLEWSVKTLEEIPVLPVGAYGPGFDDIPASEYETGPEAAQDEAERLASLFAAFPESPDSLGVIHYDFETDNVFWQQDSNRCVPIDFDDAMVFWYIADIAQALDSLKETIADKAEASKADSLETWQQAACGCFLAGYRSIRPISDEMLAFIPAFLRFTALYGYARIVRSLSEVHPDEPEWMADLRKKLHQLMRERRAVFGNPLVQKP